MLHLSPSITGNIFFYYSSVDFIQRIAVRLLPSDGGEVEDGDFDLLNGDEALAILSTLDELVRLCEVQKGNVLSGSLPVLSCHHSSSILTQIMMFLS